MSCNGPVRLSSFQRNEPSYSRVRPGLPAARGDSRGRRPCRRGSARCVRGATPWSPRSRTCSSAPVPCSQWVRIGAPVRRWVSRGGLEHAPVAGGQPALGPGDLDDPGTERGPAHDRPRVVVRIDAVGDVRGEQVGELLDRDPVAPVRRAVVAVVMQPGRRDDVDPGPPRDARRASRRCGPRRTASHRRPTAARARPPRPPRSPSPRRPRDRTPAPAGPGARRR